MDIRIGGRLGPDPKFGDVVVRKVPNWELNETLLRIFSLYETNHGEGETFRDFAGRTQPEWWTEQLTPEEVGPGRPRGGRSMSARRSCRSARPPPPAWPCSAPSRRRSRSSSTCSVEVGPACACSRSTPACCSPRRYETWRPLEERYGIDHRVEDAASRRTGRWAAEPTLRRSARSPRSSARSRRRRLGYRAAPRAGADAGGRAAGRARREAGPAGSSTRWPTGPRRTSGATSHEHDLPYHPLHDRGYASIGCAHCTQPGAGRDGRWAGLDKTECGLHV